MVTEQKIKQPFLHSYWLDGIFILSPPFLCLLAVILFPSVFNTNASVNEVYWVILVLLIDVAHVYSTLFRTYFDKEIFAENKSKLIIIPILVLVISIFIYSTNSLIFWRIMAYIAVYHFIRQQYGFMRLYSRNSNYNKTFNLIDSLTIYSSTIYPMLFWHLSGDRNFEWFIKNDFLNFTAPIILELCFVLYVLILLIYLIKEVFVSINQKNINWPKNILIIGTAISWYVGIVYFNGDLIFTLFNVVTHGIPYMALIWIYGKKRSKKKNVYSKFSQLFFSKFGLFLFLGLIFLFAYVEEGLWNAWVWKEQKISLSFFNYISTTLSKESLSLIVPLLSLPQITHYIIDGFIWKISKGHQLNNN